MKSISWKIELAVASGVPLLLGILMGIFSGFNIYQQNITTRTFVGNSIAQQGAALSTQFAIVNFDRALQSVIVASEKKGIRKHAIGAIKAAAELDETLQNFSELTLESPEVMDLKARLQALRPGQMKILKFAKRNKDDQAYEQLKLVKPKFTKFVEIAESLASNETAALLKSSEDNFDNGKQVILTLGLVLN